MKYILFIDSLGSGGAQRQFVGLANMLVANGNDVTIVTYHDIPFYKDSLTVPNDKLINIEDGDSYYKRILHFFRIVRKSRPNWVVSYLESPSVIACLCHILIGRFKLLVSERNTTQKLSHSDKIRFFLYRFADIIVCNSFSQKKYIDDNYPNLTKKNFTIPNFVDLDRFSPNLEKKKNNVIIVVATICESKNTMGLIEAARLVKNRGGFFVVKWFGITSDITEYINVCIKKIKEYGLEDMFLLLKKTNCIELEYKSSSFLCLPSFYEGTPNALCEGMASGLPIICSNVCDNGIYVKNGVNGYLFNPDDYNDMASQIENILSLPDSVYSDFCISSRKIAMESFSSSNFYNKYMSILASYEK